MQRLAALCPALILLAGCSGWPDVPRADGAAETTEWPELLPIDQIGGPAREDDPDALRAALLARADALQSRAAILRRPAGDDTVESDFGLTTSATATSDSVGVSVAIDGAAKADSASSATATASTPKRSTAF